MKTEQTQQKQISYFVVNNRITGNNKIYYENQLKEFCSFFDYDNKVLSIHFGRQDIRGSPSITIIHKNHCATNLKYFSTMKELLSFIEGFNLSFNKTNLKYTSFEGFLKEVLEQ